LDPTSSQKPEDEKRAGEARKRDDVAELLRIQRDSISRTARFWVESGMRLQRGDLDAQGWLDFQARYIRDTLDFVKEAAGLLPLKPRNTTGSGDKSR
jgi:hypothetical protein